jgi:nucleotide-binding universal stress UspA family protein
MEQVKERSVVWALDAFAEDGEADYRNTAQWIRKWQKRGSLRVFPVFVLSSRQFGLGYEFEYDSSQYLERQAKARMSVILRKLKMTTLEPPAVIFCPGMSRTQEVDALSKFAVDHEASLVLTNTHARGGVRRLWVGSFTEAALMRSHVPVLTMNPHVKRFSAPEHILFPTEFGRYANRVFRRVVDFAREHGARITLMHVGPSIRANELMVGAFGYPIPAPIVDQERDLRRRRVESHFKSWARYGNQHGVKVDFVTIRPGTKIAECILSEAKRLSVGLIALESESGWMSSALLGSVSRQVIRHASCPVWVIRARLALAAKASHRTVRRKEKALKAA